MLETLVSAGSLTAAILALVPAILTFTRSQRKEQRQLELMTKDIDQKLKRLAEIRQRPDDSARREVDALLRLLEADLGAIRKDVSTPAVSKSEPSRAEA